MRRSSKTVPAVLAAAVVVTYLVYISYSTGGTVSHDVDAGAGILNNSRWTSGEIIWRLLRC